MEMMGNDGEMNGVFSSFSYFWHFFLRLVFFVQIAISCLEVGEPVCVSSKGRHRRPWNDFDFGIFDFNPAKS